MSRSTPRPMSEYESATFFALLLLAEEFAKLTSFESSANLLARLRDLRESRRLDGRNRSAAKIDLLIKAIARNSRTDFKDV